MRNKFSFKYGTLAQLAEQRSVKPWVEGSSPSVSAIIGLIHGVSDLN